MYDETNENRGMMTMITSVQNKMVKEWKKLHKRKYRYEQRRFLVEGFHLIEEAFESDWDIEMVIVQNGVDAPDWMGDDGISVVSERVFKEITQTESPQGIAAIIQMKQLPNQRENHVLLIDAVQDPGNLGTIIRTADAAGFSSVCLGTGTVDPFNEKVIRASQGSIFHIPIYSANLSEEIEKLKAKSFTIFASALQRAKHYLDVEYNEKTALIVGNEGAGIQEELLQLADEVIKIPIYGKAESLNVSVAAGILMYQMRNYLHK